MGPVAQKLQLPSFYELLRRFSLFDSSAFSSCDVQIGADGSVFCTCDGCVRWRDFVDGRDATDAVVKYEVFTREHVAGLACYLRARAAAYNLSLLKVLETWFCLGCDQVGAGSGRLSQFLNTSLAQLFIENQGLVVSVTATDSGARGLSGPGVKQEDAFHAITQRKPHIVISSWMPRGFDWTARMRAEQSVYEYILIGETDNGICGCPWQTWGFSSSWDCTDDSDSESGDMQLTLDHRTKNHGVSEDLPAEGQQSELASVSRSFVIDSKSSLASDEMAGRATREAPPYVRDGWERVELESLSRVQVCRTDERWSTIQHSHTVSFRKT